MKKKSILSFLFIIFLSGLVLYPGNTEKIIRTGTRAEPTTLDPAEAWDDSSAILIANIFDTLVVLNPKTLEIVPSLALSWKSENNGKVWIFKLREGIKFHDGTPFNADAVLFSFNRQMDKNSQFRYYDFPMFIEVFPFLKDVRKSDQYTVIFTLSESFYPFPSTLTVDCASIVSPEAVKKSKKTFRSNPVGTGAFKFSNWTKGKRIVLKANMEFWKGEPKIDKYITVVDPNFSNLLSMFMNQRIDILLSHSLSKMVSLKKLKWVSISLTPSLSTNFMALNLKNKYLKKIGVRKALNHLWNKKILKLVYQDFAKPLCTLIPEGISGHDCNLDKYPLSVKKARELLKNESLEKGFQLRLLILEDSQLELQMMKIFSRNLKKVKIELKIERVSSEEYDKRVSDGDYDLTIAGWMADYPDPDSILNPLFSKKLREQGMPNLSTGDTGKIIPMIDEARREKDKNKRQELYIKLNEHIVENALFLPLYQTFNIVIYNKRVGIIEKNPFGEIDLYKVGNN